MLFSKKNLVNKQKRSLNINNPKINLYPQSATSLSHRLSFFSLNPKNILIAGDYKNYVTPLIKKQFPKSLLYSLHNIKEAKPHIVGSEETLPFQNCSFDIIISFFSIHWFENPHQYLKKIKLILNNNGIFLGVFFGDNSLKEIKSIFLKSDLKIYDKIFPRFSPIITQHQIYQLLQKNTFSIYTTDKNSYRYRTNFDNFIKSIRSCGETNNLIKKKINLESKKYFFYLKELFIKSNPTIQADTIFITAKK